MEHQIYCNGQLIAEFLYYSDCEIAKIALEQYFVRCAFEYKEIILENK